MKRLFVLLLMPLLFSCGSVSDKSQETSFRLLYWNIQNGMWDGQGDNYDRFVNWVKSKDPDVCVWCEARSIYYTGTNTKMKEDEKYLVSAWPELAGRYGHRYIYVCGMRDNYPQVITSKTPIHGIKRILGDENDVIVAHGAGWGTITVHGRTLNLVTFHAWPHAWAYQAEDKEQSKAENGGDTYRAREVAYVCNETIGSQKDGNWLMMGDFNSICRSDNALYGLTSDSPKFQAQDYICEKTAYVDIIKHLFPDEVIVSTWINTRYDYVFCTQDLLPHIKNAEIIKDEYTTPVKDEKISSFAHPSDHLPIIVDFEL